MLLSEADVKTCFAHVTLTATLVYLEFKHIALYQHVTTILMRQVSASHRLCKQGLWGYNPVDNFCMGFGPLQNENKNPPFYLF